MVKKTWKIWIQSLLKLTISQKLRVAKKKLFMQKIIIRSIRIFPANLAIIENKLSFCASFWTYWTHITLIRDMMCYDFFSKYLFSAHSASFMTRCSLLRGMGGSAYPYLGQSHGFVHNFQVGKLKAFKDIRLLWAQ